MFFYYVGNASVTYINSTLSHRYIIYVRMKEFKSDLGIVRDIERSDRIAEYRIKGKF